MRLKNHPIAFPGERRAQAPKSDRVTQLRVGLRRTLPAASDRVHHASSSSSGGCVANARGGWR
jgi:hypothetical protein